jgi:Domain of unknown function (DUF4389)
MEPSDHPVKFSVDYPDRELDRLTTFFRIFTVIPIAIVAALLQHASFGWNGNEYQYAGGGALVFLPAALMIIFREKYPRWWYDWNIEVLRFGNRVSIYLALMDDAYPSTDEQQAVHLDFPYPDVPNELHRGMPIVKWVLAIPHYVVLAFLFVGAFFAVIGAWFAILFTGRYPRGIFNYVEGVHRWWNRVIGYAFTLVTDRYPPFSLKP